MTTSDFIVKLDTPDGLIPQLQRVQSGLVEGLLSIELPDGWADTYLSESLTATWTSAVVLISLLRQGVIPDNYLPVLNRILEEKQSNEFTGWRMDRFSSYISTYVTSDVLSLLLMMHKLVEAEPVIHSLQEMQNKDGGWGVCPGDKESKVGSTAWVVNALLDALDHPATREFIRIEKMEEAINWLYSAQSDCTEDCGWGFLPDSPPSSVNCTTVALFALLKAIEVEPKLRIREEALRRGIHTLKSLGREGFWKGDIEDFGIMIDGNFVGRHTTGGVGTLAVVRTLLAAIRNGLLPPNDNELFHGITNLLSRCKTYPGKDGLWISPSDQGGAPVIWNSVEALHAIFEIQQFKLNMLEGSYVDRQTYDRIYSKVKYWKRFTIALLVAIAGISLTVYFKSLVPAIQAFSEMPALIQGVIFIVVTIIIEELYFRLIKPTFSRMIQSRR